MDRDEGKSVNWKSVAVYYAIACLWSWPFFWWRDVLHRPESSLLLHWALMWGPGIAAILSLRVFRRSHQRIITFWGNSLTRSILFYSTPFVLLALFHSHSLHYFNLGLPVAACAMFVAICGEELGWRGFLQDALRPLSPITRYLAIGVLWETWHFTTHIHGGVVVVLAMFYVFVISLSFVIGYAAERSHSLMVAVSLHTYVDLFLGNSDLWVPMLLVLPIWIALLMVWPPASSAVNLHDT